MSSAGVLPPAAGRSARHADDAADPTDAPRTGECRDLALAAPVALLGVRLDGTVTFANRAAEALLRSGAEELLTRRLDELVPGMRSWVDELREVFLRQAAEQSPGTPRRFSAVCLDGRSVPVEMSLCVARGGDDPLVAVALRRQAARSDASEARLAAIVMSSHDAIIGKDLSGVITSWNPGAERLLGYAAGEIVGGHVRRLVPAHLWAEEDEIFRLTARGGRVEGYETVRVRKDGSLVDVALAISPVLDSEGRIGGLASVLHDVTVQKNVARRSQELSEAILNILDDFAQEKDRLGQTHRAVLNILDDFVEEKDRLGESQRALLNILEDIDEERGNAERVNESLREEIIQRTAAESTLRTRTAELTASNAELEQFAYVASHDLQEPLRKVTSFCQLLGRRYQGRLDETADSYITYVVDGALRMQLLIDDLLTFARLGRTSGETAPVDCAVALQAALENLAAAVEESGAKVAVLTPLPVVPGDLSRVVHLFQNLVGNAIKFRSEYPPRIEVRADREGDGWVFTVTDNGIGIEPKYSERIFAVFQRLHVREQYAGTGIGLAICKKIVDQMGGRIWVESVLGQGASFHWTVPDPGARDRV